jgi:hypothetical protein
LRWVTSLSIEREVAALEARGCVVYR